MCRGAAEPPLAVGVHPELLARSRADDLPAPARLQSDPSVVALGEMGLDYFHHYAPPAQVQIFEPQLQLAAELGRPVVIHCREATDDMPRGHAAVPAVRAVFHCFTGTPDEAPKILDAGYLLGFTGAVDVQEERRAARGRRADAAGPDAGGDRRAVPDAGAARAQKTNEPAMVVHVAATGRVKGMSVREWTA